MSEIQNGKGDSPRPMNISKDEYGKRFESIFGKTEESKKDSDEDDICWEHSSSTTRGNKINKIKRYFVDFCRLLKRD